MATINNDYRTLQRFLELKEWIEDNIVANDDASPVDTLDTLRIGNKVYSVSGGGGGGGSVSRVGLTMPAAFNVSGSPITSTGTLEVTLKGEYEIPTTTDTAKWNNLNQVIANTSETATTSLTSLKVGNTVYSITGGGGGGGDGTVTSVGLSMPTGFTVTGTPITTTGTLTVTMASGYSIPQTADITKWNALTQVTANPSTTTDTLTSITIGSTSYAIASGSVSSVDLSYAKTGNTTTGVSLSVNGTVASTLDTQNNININNNTDLQKLATAYGVYKSVVMPQPTAESGQTTYQVPNFTQNNIMVGGSNPTIGDSHNYYIKDSGYSITTTIDTTTTQSNSLPTVEAVKTYVQGVISSMTYNGELE